MHIDWWGATDRGRVRPRNEDDFLLDPGLGLAVVADGIGGLHRGDIAARLACRVVREYLISQRADLHAFSLLDGDPYALRRIVEDRLREAIQRANTEVFHAGIALSHGRGMGCALDAALIIGNTAFVAHVGDTRTWHISNGRALTITEDHTLAQEKLRRGIYTAAQAERSPERHMLTRSVGGLPIVRVDTHILTFEPGQQLLMCSDGITRYISTQEISTLASPGEIRPLESLIELANLRGGIDNSTAVLVAANTAPPSYATVTALQLAELRMLQVFETATGQELRWLAQIAEWRELKPGAVLFREGDSLHEWYAVLEGEVWLTQQEHIFTKVTPGESFGEEALFDEHMSPTTASVKKPGRAIVLPSYHLHQLLRRDDGIASRLLGAIARRRVQKNLS